MYYKFFFIFFFVIVFFKLNVKNTLPNNYTITTLRGKFINDPLWSTTSIEPLVKISPQSITLWWILYRTKMFSSFFSSFSIKMMITYSWPFWLPIRPTKIKRHKRWSYFQHTTTVQNKDQEDWLRLLGSDFISHQLYLGGYRMKQPSSINNLTIQNEKLQVMSQLTKFQLKRTIYHGDLFLG